MMRPFCWSEAEGSAIGAGGIGATSGVPAGAAAGAAPQPVVQPLPQAAVQPLPQAVVQPLPQAFPQGAAQAASQGEAQVASQQLGAEQQLDLQQLFLWQNRPLNRPQCFFLQQGAEVQQLLQGAAQAGSQAAVQPLPHAFPQGAAQAGSQALVQPLPQAFPQGAAQQGSQAGAQQLDSQGDEQQLLLQHFFLWQSNRPFRPQNRSCEWHVLTPQCEQPHLTPPSQHPQLGSQQLLVQLLQLLQAGAAQQGSQAVVQPLLQLLQGAAQPGSQADAQPLLQLLHGAAQPGSHAAAQPGSAQQDDFSQHFGAQQLL